MPRPSPNPALAEAGLRHVRLAGVGLIVATLLAYLTSFWGVMVFDDHYAIVDNPLIRDLRRLDLILFPPAEGGTIAGRPVVNLTLALNHALGGLAPAGYHAVNLAIHVAAALVLFGLVRRTLDMMWRAQLQPGRGPAGAGPSSRDAIFPALAVAALWTLHPLQTGAVTYVIQRAESLGGLLYLLTLYCFVRAVSPEAGGGSHPDAGGADQSAYKTSPTPRHSRAWFVLSFLSCLFGMATKEVMASAPLLVLLYDRTFVAASWREAWQRRRGLHLALMATWLLLAVLVFRAEGRGGSAGFATAIGWWPYLLTQCQAIVHYLRLAIWPEPLVFDYGTPLVSSVGLVLPQALLLLALLGATAWALVRKPVAGFLGAWFFLILAPSSSVVPVATQTMAEHRMYLPLAAVMAALLWVLRVLVGPYRAVIVALGLALAGAGLTAARNCDYHSELALWADTVAHRPQNARAHTNLGLALAEAGRQEEAVAEFEHALALEPDNAATRLNLCGVLNTLNRPAEAVPHGEAAVRLAPDSILARMNLGDALEQLGRLGEAAAQYEEALRIEPAAREPADALAAVSFALGNQAASLGKFEEAIARYRRSVAVAPNHVAARANLGNAQLISGRVDEAVAAYREVLRLNPADTRVQENLAHALELQRQRRP